MRKFSIYDPSLCCSTGVCGVDVDQTHVNTAVNLDWLKSNGAEIERFNLSQQPLAFAENASVKSILETDGADALPVIMIDGEIVMKARRSHRLRHGPNRTHDPAYCSCPAPGASIIDTNPDGTSCLGAGIEPWGWVVNNSLLKTQTSSPLLRQRANHELKEVEKLRSGLAKRLAIVPLQMESPTGVEKLAALGARRWRGCVSRAS